MKLITKENLRLSGIYGKKILNSINATLIKDENNTLHYAKNKTHLFYYKTNKKIYISGNNSEELYNNIIRNIEYYLLRLGEIDDDTLKLRLGMVLYNETSLQSYYHILNMEVLRGIAIKYPERFSFAEYFATTISFLEQPFYEELMYFILLCEDEELVLNLCEELQKASYSEIHIIWNKFNNAIDLEDKEIIDNNLKKIKI